MPCWWCVCTSDHQSLSTHTPTQTHTHKSDFYETHAFNTRMQVHGHARTHTLVWSHTCFLSLMSPVLWQGTNQSWVQKFKGVRDCLVRFSLCYWSHFTGIIAKLSHKPRDGDGLKVDDWERRQGDIHCNLSPPPTPSHPHRLHQPPPNMQRNPMTLKVRTEAGVFGADRMRPINLNLRYLAVKETLLAEIRSVFFIVCFVLFCFSRLFAFLLQPSYCMSDCLKVCCHLLFFQIDEKDTGERTPPDSTSQSVWET